jgi:hypothetical protein
MVRGRQRIVEIQEAGRRTTRASRTPTEHQTVCGHNHALAVIERPLGPQSEQQKGCLRHFLSREGGQVRGMGAIARCHGRA